MCHLWKRAFAITANANLVSYISPRLYISFLASFLLSCHFVICIRCWFRRLVLCIWAYSSRLVMWMELACMLHSLPWRVHAVGSQCRCSGGSLLHLVWPLWWSLLVSTYASGFSSQGFLLLLDQFHIFLALSTNCCLSWDLIWSDKWWWYRPHLVQYVQGRSDANN